MTKLDDFYLVDINFNGNEYRDIVAAPNRDLGLIKGLENYKQALYNCLVTYPDSLVHRPGYGVGVQGFIGEIGSIAKQKELAIRIKDQFEQDFRTEKFNSVSFEQKENGLFYVKYTVTAKAFGTITETINPFGEVTL